jgi:putative transposase
MRKSKFSESKIVSLLKEAEAGRKVSDICREHGISNNTFYQWRSKFGGMEASDIRRLKELQEENEKLKRMYADMALEN